MRTLTPDPGAILRVAARDKDFGFEVTASWKDVQRKAKRIRAEGGVTIVVASNDGIGGQVKGDLHTYEAILVFAPGTRKVADWTCGCAWAAYAFDRSPAFKRFEGRICSHALALQFEAQSQGMFGKEIHPSEPPKKVPTVVKYDPDDGKSVFARPYEGSLAAVAVARLRAEGADPAEVIGTLIQTGMKHAAARDLWKESGKLGPQDCEYCDRPATKALMWAEHMAYVPVCDDHEQRATDHLEGQGNDVEAVRDLPQKTAKQGTYFHNTFRELEPGDELKPASELGLHDRWHDDPHYSPHHVYMWHSDAHQHPEMHDDFREAFGDHTYEVQPEGRVEADPERESARDWERSQGTSDDEPLMSDYTYRAPRARVVRKVESLSAQAHSEEEMRCPHCGGYIGPAAIEHGRCPHCGHPLSGGHHHEEHEGREAKLASYGQPNDQGLYLRFGHWPKDERSHNNVTGGKEDGVSVYDLDRHGEPMDPDPDMNRGHHHDEYCEPHCDLDEGDEEYGNDTLEEMHGRVQRAETNRRRGHDIPAETGHLVKGEMVGFGHDGEPLLRNVKRIGDWIDHRHHFLPGAEPHRLADEENRHEGARQTGLDLVDAGELGPVLAAKEGEPEGPTHAGIALKAHDTGRVLMLQRSLEDEDDPARGTWEFPGGGREDGDLTSLHNGIREFQEEVGQQFPAHGVVKHTWTSPNGIYQGHVVVIPRESDLSMKDGRVVPNPDDPKGDHHEQAVWWSVEHAKKNPALRPEVKAHTPWKEIERASLDAQKTAAQDQTAVSAPSQAWRNPAMPDQATPRRTTYEPDTTRTGSSWDPISNTQVTQPGRNLSEPQHSTSKNPASTGFATSEDPNNWDNVNTGPVSGSVVPAMSFDSVLHAQPEPALPSTDGGAEYHPEIDPEDLDPIPDNPETPDPYSPTGSVPPTDGSLTPNTYHSSLGGRSAADIVAEFQKSAAGQALMTPPSAQQDSDDIAAAAQAHLSKTALADFSPEEQRELINEAPDARARNFDGLKLEGSHYALLEEAMRTGEVDPTGLFL